MEAELAQDSSPASAAGAKPDSVLSRIYQLIAVAAVVACAVPVGWPLKSRILLDRFDLVFRWICPVMGGLFLWGCLAPLAYWYCFYKTAQWWWSHGKYCDLVLAFLFVAGVYPFISLGMVDYGGPIIQAVSSLSLLSMFVIAASITLVRIVRRTVAESRTLLIAMWGCTLLVMPVSYMFFATKDF